VIQKVKGFGRMELRLIFALEQRKEQLFTIRDAKLILGSSDASVWNVLKRLRKKKRVIPIQNGVYLFAPMRSGEEGHWTEDAFKTVPSLVNTDDYYIGFVSAMNHWGMTEQLPYVVHVALLRQKRPVEAVQSRFVFVKKKRLGDFVQVKLGGRAVNVSSPEQTILDGLSFPEYSSGVAGMAKAIHFARKEIDWNKLLRLAMKDAEAVRRRLGYVLRLLGFKKQAEELKKSGSGFRGLVWLDPSARKDEFTHDMEWGLKVNVGRERLLEFREGH
jgi:predicted transcriptional regulator of viral defense system